MVLCMSCACIDGHALCVGDVIYDSLLDYIDVMS